MKLFSTLFYSLIYIADDRMTFLGKIVMYLKLILAFSPIAYVLNIADLWFTDNKKFVAFFILTVIVNSGLGIWKHKKTNDFNWETFFIKTGRMLVVIIATYFLLSMITGIVDEGIVKWFEVTIQVMTLFYPASKGLKSIFVISNGEYPPKWIMKKVYNFEEDGNVLDLLSKQKSDEK